MLWNLIVSLIIGAVAGRLMNSRGGLVRNILLGIAGGFVGGIIGSVLNASNGMFASVILSIAGACLVIWLYRKLRK